MRMLAFLLCLMAATPAWAVYTNNNAVVYNNDVDKQTNLLISLQKQQADLIVQVQSLKQELEDIKKLEEQQVQQQQKMLELQTQSLQTKK